MAESSYTPPKVWEWAPGNGGKFANINRPTAGPTHEKKLPVGKHPHQLYRWPRRTASRSRSCSRNCSRAAFPMPNTMPG